MSSKMVVVVVGPSLSSDVPHPLFVCELRLWFSDCSLGPWKKNSSARFDGGIAWNDGGRGWVRAGRGTGEDRARNGRGPREERVRPGEERARNGRGRARNGGVQGCERRRRKRSCLEGVNAQAGQSEICYLALGLWCSFLVRFLSLLRSRVRSWSTGRGGWRWGLCWWQMRSQLASTVEGQEDVSSQFQFSVQEKVPDSEPEMFRTRQRSGEGVMRGNGRPKGCFWRVCFFSAPVRFALKMFWKPLVGREETDSPKHPFGRPFLPARRLLRSFGIPPNVSPCRKIWI